jgi:transglutaminase-like putative cysteine protease
MHPSSILSHLLCLTLFLCFALDGIALEEESLFSGDEAISASPAGAQQPNHPATAYWKISATVDLKTAPPGTHVQMLLPLSDARQSVLERRTGAEGVNYREEADGLNLWGHWLVTHGSGVSRQLFYEYTVQIVDAATVVPTVPFPPQQQEVSVQPDLVASALIQSDSELVRARAAHLVGTHNRVDQVVWAAYQHVATFLSLDNGGQQNDALAVIQSQRGSRLGKTRALVAVLRAAGIPARIVGGIRLGDSARKRTTISWVEARIGDAWVPMDPTAGYFAWLPNTYLALYRNDLPLLIHTRKVPVEYTFFIRPVSRNAVLPAATGSRDDQAKTRQGLRYEGERLRAVTTYVDQPLANIVLLNDGPIAQGTVEQMLAEAKLARVNAALLSVDFESSFSREHVLQSLVSDNLTLIREANLLLVNTTDTAGIYALLKQGEQRVRLDDLRVVIVSHVPRLVSAIFAAVLESLLKPTEIVLLTQPVDILTLWRVGAASAQAGKTVGEQLQRDGFVATVVNAETVAGWSWWRRQVVRLWTLAVQSHVPLPALSLILVLPLIAFFLVILRNVIGLETFGTFSPMLLALAFLTTGLIWGMVVFAIIVGLGTGLRLALQGLRLHLVSRVAILIAIVAVSMVGLTVLGATFGIGALLHVSIFPMVIMANIIENFTNTQLERGTREAFRLTFHTLLVATVSYIGIESTGLKPFVLAFPELLIGIIGVEILLGRWRGLRLLEYVRFAKLMRQAEVQPAVETRKASTG